MRKVLLSCASAVLLFSACKKSDNGGGGGNTRSTTLTNGKWLQTAQTSQTITNGVGGLVDDDFAGMSACEKDDYTIFNSSNLIIIDEGATKCDATDPQQYTVGQWTLLDSDTKLRQSGPSATINWEIDQLDGSTLKMSNYITNGNVVYKNTSTFTHIP